MAGTVTLSVIGDWTSSAVVTPDKEVTLNADEWQKVTGTFTLASDASQVVVVRFEETAGVAFCLDDLRVAEEPIPVTLSGVTCGNRVYNGTAYAYTGTPVWTTEDGTAVTGETKKPATESNSCYFLHPSIRSNKSPAPIHNGA